MAGPPPLKPNPVRPIPPPLNSAERQAALAAEAARPPPPKTLPKWRQGFRAVVPWLLASFLCGLVIQVFLAGYGLPLLGNQGMQYHVQFAGMLELVPLVILLAGFLGADKWAGIGGIVLAVQFSAQHALLASTNTILRALHPTNGVLMLLLTLGLLLHRPMWKDERKPTPAAA